jgi:hypothetical protein
MAGPIRAEAAGHGACVPLGHAILLEKWSPFWRRNSATVGRNRVERLRNTFQRVEGLQQGRRGRHRAEPKVLGGGIYSRAGLQPRTSQNQQLGGWVPGEGFAGHLVASGCLTLHPPQCSTEFLSGSWSGRRRAVWARMRGAVKSRGVAQPGSAPALGAGGRQFKSDRPDHTSC